MDNLRLESDGDSRLESGAVQEEDEEEAVDPNNIRLASEDNRLESGSIQEEATKEEATGNEVLLKGEDHRRESGPVQGEVMKQEDRKNEDRTGNDEESHPPNKLVRLREAVKGDLRFKNEDDRLKNGATLEERKIEDVRI